MFRLLNLSKVNSGVFRYFEFYFRCFSVEFLSEVDLDHSDRCRGVDTSEYSKILKNCIAHIHNSADPNF